MSLNPKQKNYYLSLNKARQSLFFGLNDKQFNTLINLPSGQESSLWKIASKDRIKYLDADEEKKEWSRLVSMSIVDMERYFNYSPLNIAKAPLPPVIIIPTIVEVPELPLLVKIPKPKAENSLEFSQRLNKVKSIRYQQIKPIVKLYQQQIKTHNLAVDRVENEYEIQYQTYLKKLEVYNKIQKNKLLAHQKKLQARRRPKTLKKRN